MARNIIYIYNVDVHTIAAVKVKENYEGVAEGYEECFQYINEVLAKPEIMIAGIKYQLEFFLCCDYKVCYS